MSVSTFEIQQGGRDYSTWRAPANEYAGAMPNLTPEAKVAKYIKDSVVPIDPEKAHKMSVRRLQGNGHAWYLVDAVRASSITPYNPRRVPPAHVGRIVDRIAEYSVFLAQGGNLPSGLTVLPEIPDTVVKPTVYRLQEKGTGTDDNLTAFIARLDIPDPVDPSQIATTLVVNAMSRNDDLEVTLGRFEPFGYARKDKGNGKKQNNARR